MRNVFAAVGLGIGMVLSGITSAADTVTTMDVERQAFGKPPFKRSFNTVQVTDIAAADVVSASDVETVEVRTVEMGANRKAPYRRSTVSLAVTDIAAADVDTEEAGKRFNHTRKPPYNRHR